MKRAWCTPQLELSQFAANEYVAQACTYITTTETQFVCDAGGGVYGSVYVDDGDGKFEPEFLIWSGEDDRIANSSYHACGETHTLGANETLEKGWFNPNSNSLLLGFDISKVLQVLIWRGKEGNNVHCSTNLNLGQAITSSNRS